MDFSKLPKENYDIKLSKVFAKLDKIVSPKELKKVKQEKESLIVQLSESHVVIDIIDTLENKLKESEDLLKNSSSDNLKACFVFIQIFLTSLL
jgi:GTP-binding protein EngB required for normal cell division